MRYCPTCRLEYRPGITHCPDCGQPLRTGALPPQEAALPPPDTESVRLCTVPDPTEAEIIRAALNAAGIPTLVRRHGPLTGELATVADGATHDYAIIFVPRNRLPEAKRLLTEIQSGPIQWPEGMEPSDEDEDS